MSGPSKELLYGDLVSGPSKELLIRRDRAKGARIAELQDTIERLKCCGNCGNHNGYKQDCSLDRSPCYERSHCHFTPSRWAERITP